MWIYQDTDTQKEGWENMILTNEGILGYGLVNQKSGKLYVNAEMYQAYKNYNGDDSDEFALKQLGYSSAEIEAYLKHRDTKGTYYPIDNANQGSATIGLRAVNPSTDKYNSTNKYYEKDPMSGGYKEVPSMSNSIYLQTANGEQKFTSNARQLYTAIQEGENRTPSLNIVDVYAMKNELISSPTLFPFFLLIAQEKCDRDQCNCYYYNRRNYRNYPLVYVFPS